MDGKALLENARQFGLELTRTQLEAFALYEGRLYEANSVMNLTRIAKEDCWSKHFLDSLTLSPHIPKNSTVLDIGTGAGTPGAALAIARPDLTVSVMDSAGKAIGFLDSVFGSAGPLPVLFRIIQARAEDAGRDSKLRESFDFVTGRALAVLPIQGELSAAFVRVGGLFVPMRTPNDKNDVRFGGETLGLQLVETHSPVVKALGATRFLPVYKKTGRTPSEFPRKWAQISTKPLG